MKNFALGRKFRLAMLRSLVKNIAKLGSERWSILHIRSSTPSICDGEELGPQKLFDTCPLAQRPKKMLHVLLPFASRHTSSFLKQTLHISDRRISTIESEVLTTEVPRWYVIQPPGQSDTFPILVAPWNTNHGRCGPHNLHDPIQPPPNWVHSMRQTCASSFCNMATQKKFNWFNQGDGYLPTLSPWLSVGRVLILLRFWMPKNGKINMRM